MTLFPFMTDIEGKRFLVVGGGRVAVSKVERLSRFTGNIRVIAREAPSIEGVEVIIRDFRMEDLEGVDYCIAATSDKELNGAVARECTARGILVDVADDPSLCTFVLPGMIKRGKLVVAVSTGGASPACAARLRQMIESVIPDHIELILEKMEQLRSRAAGMDLVQSQRASIYREVLDCLLGIDGAAYENSGEEISGVMDSAVENILKKHAGRGQK